jgi:hypothetical protein
VGEHLTPNLPEPIPSVAGYCRDCRLIKMDMAECLYCGAKLCPRCLAKHVRAHIDNAALAKEVHRSLKVGIPGVLKPS